MMNIVDQALNVFFDPESKLSFEDKFSNLRQAYMWAQINIMRKVQEHGKTSEYEAESEKLSEGLKQFKALEKLYAAEVKSNKMAGKVSKDTLDQEWLRKIKASDGNLGAIVREQKHD